MAELTTALSDATFDEEVGAADGPVLVDFWAEWCGPCKLIDPILEEVAKEHQGRLRVVKLNVDDNLETVRRFDVMSVPTLILFKEGVPQLRLVGAKGKAQLLQELSRHLEPEPKPTA
jgi:thioredoxin 1